MRVSAGELEKRLEELNGRIDGALNGALRNRSKLFLIAVTKRQPMAVIKAAYDLGLRHFGENQIQEAVPKVKAAQEDVHWHFIGHLQKNKARKAVKHFATIHSVDSLSLLKRLDVVAGEERVCPAVFLQVNYALDPDKQGLHPDAVAHVLEAGLAMPNLRCQGLMGIPPLSAGSEQIEEYFQGLHDLRDKLRAEFPKWPGQLSMGMTGDFEIAIAKGANWIRVGTALFGERG